MIANGEDGVHRLVRAAGVDANGARLARRQRYRRGGWIDGERGGGYIVGDEERLEIDLFDLVGVHHPRQEGGLAAGQPLAADAGCDGVRKAHRDDAGDVVGLATFLTADQRHARDDKTSLALRYTSPIQWPIFRRNPSEASVCARSSWAPSSSSRSSWPR